MLKRPKPKRIEECAKSVPTPNARSTYEGSNVAEVQAEPDARKRLEATFIDPLALTQSEFAALVKADAAKYERILREQGIKLE